MVLVRVLDCRLSVKGVPWAELEHLVPAFEVEDAMYGLVPRIENSCREVATALENYLRGHGFRRARVKALER